MKRKKNLPRKENTYRGLDTVLLSHNHGGRQLSPCCFMVPSLLSTCCGLVVHDGHPDVAMHGDCQIVLKIIVSKDIINENKKENIPC